MPQVNILLGILAHKVYGMQCFAQIGGACHAGVTIGHIKTTGINAFQLAYCFTLFENKGFMVFAAGQELL